MQRFWSVLAVQLGKHAIIVTLVGLVVTIALGFGITQLSFATGQDSYLNKDSQVYKDNVAYQRLFGGEAMLTAIEMQPGHTVDELLQPESRAQLTRFHDALTKSGQVQGVVTPLSIVPGLRVDYIGDIEEWTVDPRVTARYELGAGTTLSRAASASSTRRPTSWRRSRSSATRTSRRPTPSTTARASSRSCASASS